MKRRLIILSILFFLFYLKGLAAADYLGQQFGDMDSSQDDHVTWVEYKYYMPYPKAEDFNAADLNKDNGIKLFEWISYHNKRNPHLVESIYQYTDKEGRSYKYREGYWYKRQNEFWYQYRDGLWLKFSPVHRDWNWRGDCYWDKARRYDHDGDHYGYRFGFSSDHGCRYGCW